MGKGPGMVNPTENPPNFQQPTPTLSPVVRGLLHHPIQIEDGISYHRQAQAFFIDKICKSP